MSLASLKLLVAYLFVNSELLFDVKLLLGCPGAHRPFEIKEKRQKEEGEEKERKTETETASLATLEKLLKKEPLSLLS